MRDLSKRITEQAEAFPEAMPLRSAALPHPGNRAAVATLSAPPAGHLTFNGSTSLSKV